MNVNIGIPAPQVSGLGIVIQKADIDRYGEEEATRRAYAKAGMVYEVPKGNGD
jgi:hypothetical protein